MGRKRDTLVEPVVLTREVPAEHAARLRLAVLAALLTAMAIAVAILMSGCSTQQSQEQPADAGEMAGQAAADQAAVAEAGADDAAADADAGETDPEGDSASDGSEAENAAGAGDDATGDGDNAANENSDAGDNTDTDQSGLVEIDITPPPVIDDMAFVEGDEVIELPESTSVLIGQPAPDFTMTLLETGEDVSLSDYAGQPVLVNFWATWCPPCLLEMPFFEGVYQDHQDEDLVVIAVDAGERVPPSMIEDTVRRFVDSKGLTFPVVMGENAYDVQKAYSVGGLPATFLVDRDGTVVDAHQGAYPNQATLEDHIKSILGGEAEG